MRLIDADKVVEKMTARIKEIPYGMDGGTDNGS